MSQEYADPEGGSNPGNRPASRDDVISAYRDFLGRDPENEGAIIGRVGMSVNDLRSQFQNSQEADNYRREQANKPAPSPVPTATPGPQPSHGKIVPAPMDKAKEGANPIQGVADWLGANLFDKVVELTADVFRIRDELGAKIAQTVKDATKPIDKVVTSIQTGLSELTKGLIPSTLTLVGFALGGVETLLGTFLESAADIGDITDHLSGFFSEKQDTLFDFFGGAFGTGLESGLAGLGNTLLAKLTPSSDDINEARSAALSVAEMFRNRDV